VLLAWCFDAANAPRLIAIMAVVPALAGCSILSRAGWASPTPLAEAQIAPPPRQGVNDLRTVLAIVFALLLFFQFANEFAIAGWLPIFLIDRLGISPHSAVDLLALYWFALAAGRLGAARLLRHVRRGILLAGSAFCALFGCAALLGASTEFGTVIAILLAGIGFSAIYPLASEKISTRFSSYHPGYFNGIFTFALPGAMLVPFALGHAAAHFGLQVVPVAAMIGSCAVILLLLVIWLGRKVSGE
jgi:fucose permease